MNRHRIGTRLRAGLGIAMGGTHQGRFDASWTLRLLSKRVSQPPNGHEGCNRSYELEEGPPMTGRATVGPPLELVLLTPHTRLARRRFPSVNRPRNA